MSIFDKIKNALFHRHAEAAETPAAAAPPTAGAAPAPTQAVSPSSPNAPTSVVAEAAPTPAPAVGAPSTPAASAPAAAPANVDVAAIMDAAVKKSGQTLNWRTSIVDTLKALGLDSDIAARKELAKELNYTGDTGDSATMNVWLQKAVMKKLSENGGKVPADLMD